MFKKVDPDQVSVPRITLAAFTDPEDPPEGGVSESEETFPPKSTVSGIPNWYPDVSPDSKETNVAGEVGPAPPPPPDSAGVVAPLKATSSKYQMPPTVKPPAKLKKMDALS